MVQYLYANNATGSLVDIANVTQENRDKYYCPSCGMEMSAVLGNKREHHFRHKGDSCSYERYLHKIGKLLLKWQFEKNPKFEIEYYVTRNCPNVDCCLRDFNCANNNEELHVINLKDRYNVCEIEGSYNGFRADIKLSNSNKPEVTPLFLEVAVTHECSPEKISSGIPIVEILVSNERDVLLPLIEKKTTKPLLRQNLSFSTPHIVEKIKFYNFDRNINPNKQLSRFIAYKGNDGYIHGGIEKCIGFCSIAIGQPNESSLFEIQFDNAYFTSYHQYSIWYFGVFSAIKDGINIRNCRICQNYHSCVIHLPTNRFNIFTKERLFANVSIARLNENQFNTTHHANNCRNFKYDTQLMTKVLDHFKNLKYCISKPYLSKNQS